MVDALAAEQRSARMRAAGCKDTAPEMRVRASPLYGLSLCAPRHEAPGKPDLVFVSRRKIIFVHGCFWHKHNCRHGRISPATNSEYRNGKRERNAERNIQ